MTSKSRKDKYNSKTLDICELIGSYFVDIFYNHLYSTAKKQAAKNQTTTTQEYKNSIISYTEAINSNHKYYKQTVDSLHAWFKVNTSHLAITLDQFQLMIIKEFVPQQFTNELAQKDMDIILSEIITKTAIDFGIMVSKPQHIKQIIDSHKDDVNVKFFQNEILDILLERRDIIFNKFIEKNKSPKVDAAYFDKLKAELKNQVEINIKLKNENTHIKKMVETLYKQLLILNNKQKEQLKSTVSPSHSQVQSQPNQYSQVQSQPIQYSQQQSRANQQLSQAILPQSSQQSRTDVLNQFLQQTKQTPVQSSKPQIQYSQLPAQLTDSKSSSPMSDLINITTNDISSTVNDNSIDDLIDNNEVITGSGSNDESGESNGESESSNESSSNESSSSIDIQKQDEEFAKKFASN